MNSLAHISSVYFLGIGGIGMSALARFFNEQGIKVSGYDKTTTALSKELEAEGMTIHYTDDVKLVDRNASLVVYTPAVPQDHQELNYFRDNGYPLVKRSDALALVMDGGFNICVGGTHGKTTTSAMIAHILRHTGYGCSAFLGGISSNYGTNFWKSDNKVNVAEADEYDRSFLKMEPDIAVITAMDADHLDIYGNEKNMQDAFIEFTGKVKANGLLIYKSGIERHTEFRTVRNISYALNDTGAMAYAENIRTENGKYVFDVIVNNTSIEKLELNMGGLHNIENSIAAIIVALQLNISEEKIKAAVADFKGVKRRFEYVIKEEKMVMIDDYAHHPMELESLISGVKHLYPEKKCTVVFQPHLFSRTRDLASEFAQVLSEADTLVLLPVYPARELPLKGVSSKLIFDESTTANKHLIEKEGLVNFLEENKPELLVMCGAGDIDMLIDDVKISMKNLS